MNASQSTAQILQFSAGSERRGSARDPRDAICREKLFVQVILCGSDPELVGRTWSCRTLEARAEAIVFQCDTALPHDALVDVWVDMANRPGKFFLSGRVRTSRPDGERHQVGIDLEDGAATDIDTWRQLHD